MAEKITSNGNTSDKRIRALERAQDAQMTVIESVSSQAEATLTAVTKVAGSMAKTLAKFDKRLAAVEKRLRGSPRSATP